MSETGFGDKAGSKVWEMVVVAVVREPALPFLRWCENSVCGSDISELERALGSEDTGVRESEVEEVTAESIGSSFSTLIWGVPMVIVVSTD